MQNIIQANCCVVFGWFRGPRVWAQVTNEILREHARCSASHKTIGDLCRHCMKECMVFWQVRSLTVGLRRNEKESLHGNCVICKRCHGLGAGIEFAGEYAIV